MSGRRPNNPRRARWSGPTQHDGGRRDRPRPSTGPELVACGDCGGYGHVGGVPCPSCQGSGVDQIG